MKLTGRIMLDLLEIFAAEFISTSFLMYFGCIALIPGLDDGSSQTINSPLHAGIVWGFIVTVCITIFAPISGAHMNPAVTLCALMYERISLVKGCVYVLAQCMGASAGALLVKLTTPNDKYPENFCCTRIHSSLSFTEAIISEFMGTSILIYTVCSAWDPRNAEYKDCMPIKFGFVVSSIIFALGMYTSASINPARSFGTALVNDFWNDQWFYWLVPLCASSLTTIIYKYTFLKKYQVFSKLKHATYKTRKNKKSAQSSSAKYIFGTDSSIC